MTSVPAFPRGVEIIGHRGASADGPENTLASVRLAWEQRADAVEVDVQLSRDGRVVLFHDDTAERLCGVNRRMCDLTLAELQALDAGRWKHDRWTGERIAALDDALATIPDGKRMLIEIKCDLEILPELKRVLHRAGKDPWQTTIIGFCAETLRAVKRELPRCPVYWIAELCREELTGRWCPSADELIATVRSAGLDGLDLLACAGINEELMTAARRAGLPVYLWTVNDETEARRAIALGIAGLTTDRPGWLRERLASD